MPFSSCLSPLLLHLRHCNHRRYPFPITLNYAPMASSSTPASAIANTTTTTVLFPKLEPKTELEDDDIIPPPISAAAASIPPQIRFNSPENFDYNREMVRKTRLLYNSLKRFSIFEAEKDFKVAKGTRLRSDLRAAEFMKEKNLWLNQGTKIAGPVPGVRIGDVFFFRAELSVVGLHTQNRAEIDYLTMRESQIGYPIANSIIISGEFHGDVQIRKGGKSLAMIKAMEYGFHVRVIRSFMNDNSRVYVYDGLYQVAGSWPFNRSGYYVYNFRLVRVFGQEDVGTKKFDLAYSIRTNAMEVRPKGYLTFDLTARKERVPVFVFNDVDSDVAPLNIKYIPEAVFPASLYQGGSDGGCECVDTCGSSCSCANKNGGVFAYDGLGFLVRGKPMIYECGANCKCLSHCRNRVTQRGLKRWLEVFRSNELCWRVRTLELIKPGSFICEYSGVVLTKDQARVVSMSGEEPVYPGRFAPTWAQWGDLSEVMPKFEPLSQLDLPPLEFAVDVSSMRNVAPYIGHSMRPNVMVQNVLYDHNDMSFPRIMLFALEAIAPMTELTIAYKCAN